MPSKHMAVRAEQLHEIDSQDPYPAMQLHLNDAQMSSIAIRGRWSSHKDKLSSDAVVPSSSRKAPHAVPPRPRLGPLMSAASTIVSP